MTAKIIRRPGTAERIISDIEKRFDALSGRQVLIGWPSDAQNYPDGTSVVLVAATHEFGGVNGVTEKAFLRDTLRRNLDEYRQLDRRLAIRVKDGELSADRALGILGAQVSQDVKRQITAISLIDTGNLRNTLTWALRNV